MLLWQNHWPILPVITTFVYFMLLGILILPSSLRSFASSCIPLTRGSHSRLLLKETNKSSKGNLCELPLVLRYRSLSLSLIKDDFQRPRFQTATPLATIHDPDCTCMYAVSEIQRDSRVKYRFGLRMMLFLMIQWVRAMLNLGFR